MYVMKFGAVSVSEAARLREIVRLSQMGPEGPRVIVCTAITGITDTLIRAARGAALGDEAAVESARRDLWGRHRALAERLVNDDWEREALYHEWAALLKLFDRVTRSMHTLGDLSPRGIDAVASLGERFITHLVAVVLRQGGVAAQVIDATELIVTNNQFGAAHPLPDESSEQLRSRLQPLLRSGIVPVITGYIGATYDGAVTTLGRGGGDYTAALVGAALAAEEVCIWTDVAGILTADPKIVADARTLNELSYVEAAEIATFGAEVLHPRTLVPLAEQGIVLRLRSALRPEHPGTRIVNDPQPITQPARAIISVRNLCLLTLSATNSEDWTPDIAARALARLSQVGVDILTFTQSLSEHSLALTVRAGDASFASEQLSSAFEFERAARRVRQVTVTSPVALVAVISAPNRGELGPRTLSALGRANAHVLALSQSTVAAHISLLLPEEEVDPVVRVLHHELGLMQIG